MIYQTAEDVKNRNNYDTINKDIKYSNTNKYAKTINFIRHDNSYKNVVCILERIIFIFSKYKRKFLTSMKIIVEKKYMKWNIFFVIKIMMPRNE